MNFYGLYRKKKTEINTKYKQISVLAVQHALLVFGSRSQVIGLSQFYTFCRLITGS